ncbi:hypothetical protein ACFYUV_38290 [Nonomuraea sp. NPDC003560]|uniref:hypothetical protein n=1 Tax=Nonomuraea sp. NPDC003560 TaxID=3364341 RepID=UPI0036A4DB7B
MAYALESITPEDLVKAGRPDAAEVLAEMQIPELVAESFETDRGRMWVAVRQGLSEERRALLRQWAEEMGETLYQEERRAGQERQPDAGSDDR